MASTCRGTRRAAGRSRAIGTIISSRAAACSRSGTGIRDLTCTPGRAVLAVARGEFGARDAQKAARGIFGAAIALCLEGRGLASRDVMLAMRRRGREA